MSISEPGLDYIAAGFHFFSSNSTFLKDFLDDETSEVDSWFLMSRPWPVALITLLYLVFVLYLGPAIMKPCRPLQLRSLMLIYNLAMVVFSLWWIFKAVFEVRFTSVKTSCWTLANISGQERYNVNSLMWYYLMSKYVELLDTVFFVLRKKQNQVSFLHVYHHSNMAVFTWTFFKYVRSDQILMIGIVNSAIHAVMYSYYFLAACGLMSIISRFKPFITWLQMGQFLFLIGYLAQLLIFNCETSRKFTQFAVVNTFSFLVLFINFYHQTYSKQRVTASKHQDKISTKAD